MTHLIDFGLNVKQILFLLALLVASVITASAQSFNIKRLEQTSEYFIIYYEFEGNDETAVCQLQVFSSVDNYSKPLEKVTGDVGINVKPGANRKIIWDIKNEYGGTFKGEVQLEIRGKIYVPFITLHNMEENKIIKRAKKTPFTWTGELNNKPLLFSLYKNNELISELPDIPNTGKATIILPNGIKPGPDYYFIINEVGNSEHTIKTKEFTVKKKIHTLVKIAPVAIVAGIVVILLPEKEEDTVGEPFAPPIQKK